MGANEAGAEKRWTEDLSQTFLEMGRYMVPDRERQIEMIVDLVPRVEPPYTVLELCCGEGLLAQALLDARPECSVIGLDGSPQMLERARQRLAGYGPRFRGELFDLAAAAWRHAAQPVHAVVTSLAVHHLDDGQKQALFRDMYTLLVPGGVLIIADMIEPAHRLGREVAAKAWDQAVLERSLALAGDQAAFDFFQREHWNTYRYPDPDDIDKPSRLLDQLKWLEQAGFTDVDAYWMRAGHVLWGGVKPVTR